MYAELLLKKPSEDTSPLGTNATEYAEIVYVNSTPASPPAAAEKKS